MKNHEFTYQNPVIRGFCPDPSICSANEFYYLVCSSFQYFPGIPIYESKDLINWELIGHVLTRDSQLPLTHAGNDGGLYAPTIRFHKGRFYVVVTNVNGCGNFLVWTDDIHGDWSEPVPIDRDGIDPSLCFEENRVFFMSNHGDSDGGASILQCEIDPVSGKILTEVRAIWRGCGGRYLEGPHLYRINGFYYLMAAEGGTEYGHMEVIARSNSPYGPFETPPTDSPDANPFLTNRNLGGYPLQGTGHADLVQDLDGNWWAVLLAFRQIGQYLAFHHLGREVCLVPVHFTEDGWLRAGTDGTVRLTMTGPLSSEPIKQEMMKRLAFSNTSPGMEWVYLRNPFSENYRFLPGDSLQLRGTSVSLDNPDLSPTFLGLRQSEFTGQLQVHLHSTTGEAGISIYQNETHHYELALLQKDGKSWLIKRRTIGDMQYIQKKCILPDQTFDLMLSIRMDSENYYFQAEISSSAYGAETDYDFGSAESRYLSSEVAGGFTGVMLGLYAVNTKEQFATFSNFSYEMEYKE